MNIVRPELKFNNPMSEGKIDEIINLLHVNSTDTIIDFGGGNGEVLLKILDKSNAKGILIDIDEKSLESCRKKSNELIKTGKLVLINQDAKTYLKEIAPQSIDCVVCIGSTHAFGDYLNFIKEIIPYLKSDGFLLVGEEFWSKKPSEEYLKILGAEESESRFHHENIEAPEKLGLTYLYSNVASEDDWNKYEGTYFLEEELKALNLPEAQRQEHLKKLRAFRTAQFKFGRSTMGFGLYLFAKELQK